MSELTLEEGVAFLRDEVAHLNDKLNRIERLEIAFSEVREPPPLLQDAVRYVQALNAGLSPADVIARERGITKRSAEGRIARARLMGFLTPAVGKRRGGDLTEKALDIIQGRK